MRLKISVERESLGRQDLPPEEHLSEPHLGFCQPSSGLRGVQATWNGLGCVAVSQKKDRIIPVALKKSSEPASSPFCSIPSRRNGRETLRLLLLQKYVFNVPVDVWMVQITPKFNQICPSECSSLPEYLPLFPLQRMVSWLFLSPHQQCCTFASAITLFFVRRIHGIVEI
jgi:hypothetical protein